MCECDFSMFQFILLSCTVHMTGWLPDTVTADSIVSQNTMQNLHHVRSCAQSSEIIEFLVQTGINYVSFLISFCSFVYLSPFIWLRIVTFIGLCFSLCLILVCILVTHTHKLNMFVYVYVITFISIKNHTKREWMTKE